MQVLMLTTAAGPDGVWMAGSVVEIEGAETARRLIDGGYAVDVSIQGVARETADAPPVVEVADAPIAKKTARTRRRKVPVKTKDEK